MEQIQRTVDVTNSVGPDIGYDTGRPYALKTYDTSIYRITGMDQIQDIIEIGYVRPKGYGPRRERVGDKVYWSRGGKGTYADKRPVIEVSSEKLVDGQKGAIHLRDLTAIWMWDEQTEQYINNIENIINAYNELHPDDPIEAMSR